MDASAYRKPDLKALVFMRGMKNRSLFGAWAV